MSRAILFDLDGTLLDSVQLIVESYHYTWDRHFGERHDDAFWASQMGAPLHDVLDDLSPAGTDVDELVATYRKHNVAHHDEMVSAYPGILDALSWLKNQGHRLAVVTNKTAHMAVRGLQVCGLEDLIEQVVGVDEVTHPKPHPEPVHTALERLGQSRDGAIMVGDASHDLAAGRAAGIATAAALWGPFSRETLAPQNPDHWLDRPDQLVTL